MMRGALTILAFVSVVLFPWPLAALLALVGGLAEPLLPLAAGIFADTLYYAPASAALPWLALGGALATAAAYLVREKLAAGIIGK